MEQDELGYSAKKSILIFLIFLKIDAEKFQLALRSAIESGLRKEGEVSLWGIGKFYIRGKAVRFTPDKRLVKKATT